MSTKFKRIDEYVTEEYKKIPISICFDRPEAERWETIKNKLKDINKRSRIADFARKSLYSMMDNLESLIEEHEQKRRGA